MPLDGAPMVNRSPFYPLFDHATKWLGQGKPFEYAQQNVNLGRVARAATGLWGQGPPDPPWMSREEARSTGGRRPAGGGTDVSRSARTRSRGPIPMSGALKLEFAPTYHARQGRSRPVLRGGAEIRPRGDRGRSSRPVTWSPARRPPTGSRARTAPRSILWPRWPRGLASCGCGRGQGPRAQGAQDFVKLGGIAMGKIPAAAGRGDHPCRSARRGAEAGSDRRSRARRATARLCLRSLQDQAQGGRGAAGEVKVTIAVAGVAAVEKAFAPRRAVADGVVIARDLVNEPANVLYPEEFARRAGNLKRLGVPSTCSTSRR